MGLCSTWSLRSGLPKASRQRFRWGPGTATILRVPPLQGLSWIQAQGNRYDREQADVPVSRQWCTASAGRSSQCSLLTACSPSPNQLWQPNLAIFRQWHPSNHQWISFCPGKRGKQSLTPENRDSGSLFQVCLLAAPPVLVLLPQNCYNYFKFNAKSD